MRGIRPRVGGLALAGVIAVSLGLLGAASLTLATMWMDSQSVGGSVSASTTPDLLYIREASGPDGCGSEDDSGPDEVVFDGSTPPLLPNGAPAETSVCLQNVSAAPWEITSVIPVITETSDPSGTCETLPEVQLAIWFDSAVYDDGFLGYDPAPLPGLPRTESPFPGWFTVFVPAGGSQQIRVRISLPALTPVDCQGATWDFDIQWTATII